MKINLFLTANCLVIQWHIFQPCCYPIIVWYYLISYCSYRYFVVWYLHLKISNFTHCYETINVNNQYYCYDSCLKFVYCAIVRKCFNSAYWYVHNLTVIISYPFDNSLISSLTQALHVRNKCAKSDKHYIWWKRCSMIRVTRSAKN